MNNGNRFNLPLCLSALTLLLGLGVVAYGQNPPSSTDAEIVTQLRTRTLPLRNDADLDPLMERIGDSRFVLLGEASHGTKEYYTWRDRITRRLIAEKGFTVVAVEGDWPDAYRVNRYIKGEPNSGTSAFDVLYAYRRWPTWMWSNREIESLTEWFRSHNSPLPRERKVGFYGLDVYSLEESLDDVSDYLAGFGSGSAQVGSNAQRCFDPYRSNLFRYASANPSKPCLDEVEALMAEVRRHGPGGTPEEREAFFNAEQNAFVILNAERYYRTLNSAQSWNLRDTHMADTLDRLMRYLGPNDRAIVWEHNTHVGDARATDMADYGMVNIGQLARERHAPEGVILVGFGSYGGTVIAGDYWEAPAEVMTVPPARAGSWEQLFHAAKPENQLLLLTDRAGTKLTPSTFDPRRGHRAIGVVYRPEAESGNYVPTSLPSRYDAFMYLEATGALRPLHMEIPPGDLNGDRGVNVRDAVLSLQIAVGILNPTDVQRVVGDLNDDGTLNVSDTVLLLQRSVGT